MYLAKFVDFIRQLFLQRRVIFELARNDFRSRYLGSFLGVLWAFVQPAITIAILWFVFEAGFRTGPVNDCPYVLWLMCGLLPWNFFAECLANGTNSISEQSYLVKKVVFRVSILPLVKIISALFVHLLFVAIMVGLFIAYGNGPHWHYLQLGYYLFLTIVLALGLSWITSSVVIFIRDLGHIINIFLQFGFWLTPIFWSLQIIPEKYHFYLKLNPAFYIVEGYRDSLIRQIWFWQHPLQTAYFFVVCGFMFVVGGLVFMRLRPHFADVL